MEPGAGATSHEHAAGRTSRVARAASACVWLAVATIVAGDATRVPGAAERAIEQISQAELRSHVETLAADDFEGRGLGERGNHRAAEYVAAQLHQAGTAPAGDGYLQAFDVYRPRRGDDVRLTVKSATAHVEFALGADLWPLPQSTNREAIGPVLFAGHGIVSKRWRYDDYEDVDARGAIVLVRDGVPAALRGLPLASEAEKRELGSLAHKIFQASARGAAAVLVVRESAESAQSLWQEDRWLVLSSRGGPAAAAISTRAANRIRAAVRKDPALTARLTPGVTVEPVVAHNVLGFVEGRAPAAEGMIVVGAHLDHDGVDDEGRVLNGADDNASGTAAVLAIASAFARAAAAGERPSRAVVFALWNGEEQGSLGAEYFVDAPRPPRRVLANINLDMVGRSEDVPDPDDPRFQGFEQTSAASNSNVLHLLGYSYSPDLARLVDRANEAVRLKLKQEYDRGAQGLLQRSDQWAFLKRGVPAIFLTTGLHPDYHTPADDSDRIEYAKLERITELAARVAWLAAEGEAPRFRR